MNNYTKTSGVGFTMYTANIKPIKLKAHRQIIACWKIITLWSVFAMISVPLFANTFGA